MRCWIVALCLTLAQSNEENVQGSTYTTNMEAQLIQMRADQLEMKQQITTLVNLIHSERSLSEARKRRLQEYEDFNPVYRTYQTDGYQLPYSKQDPGENSYSSDFFSTRSHEALVITIYIIGSVILFALLYMWLDNAGHTHFVEGPNGVMECVPVAHFTHPHDPLMQEHGMNFFEAVYFSLIVQSTVGFGAFVPLSFYGRLLVMLQILSTFGMIVMQTDLFTA
jgi:hypothetical protein